MAKLDYNVDIQGNVGKYSLSREGASLAGLTQASKLAFKKAATAAPGVIDKTKGIVKENVPMSNSISKFSKTKAGKNIGLGAGMIALAVGPTLLKSAKSITDVSTTAPYAGATSPMQTDVNALTNNNTNGAYSANSAGITNATYH